MAPPKTLKWSLFKIELGDGDSPETFAAPCILHTRGMEWQTGMNETTVDDCTDPDAVAAIIRNKTEIGFSLSGQGKLNTADLATWRGWWMGKNPKTVRIRFDVSLADGGGYLEGPCHLESATIGAAKREEGGLCTFDVSITSAGAFTWTDAAA